MTVPKKLIRNILEHFNEEDIVVLIDWSIENGMDGWAEKLNALLQPLPKTIYRHDQRYACLHIAHAVFSGEELIELCKSASFRYTAEHSLNFRNRLADAVGLARDLLKNDSLDTTPLRT